MGRREAREEPAVHRQEPTGHGRGRAPPHARQRSLGNQVRDLRSFAVGERPGHTPGPILRRPPQERREGRSQGATREEQARWQERRGAAGGDARPARQARRHRELRPTPTDTKPPSS